MCVLATGVIHMYTLLTLFSLLFINSRRMVLNCMLLATRPSSVEEPELTENNILPSSEETVYSDVNSSLRKCISRI
jgi:hypothetical protein